MKTLCLIFIHIFLTLVKLCMTGGTRKIVAENLLIKQQLLIMKRSKAKCPRLSPVQRLLFGFWSTLISGERLTKAAVIISPATILKFHRALVKKKYQRLFSNKRASKKKSGPKGPSPEVIKLIVDIKRNNRTFGCPKIADMVNNHFGLDIEKDVVRRVLEKHYRPDPRSMVPSWQAFIGSAKDSLWSMDLFRCESITLRTHWVLVVMDIYSRKIVGFAVHEGSVDGLALRCMFAGLIEDQKPRYICHDHDPLFKSWWWQSLVGCLFFGDETRELWSVPYTPVSNPFIERLIGTVRREYLDRALFWNRYDLEKKLSSFQKYYNNSRVHRSLCGQFPSQWAKEQGHVTADIHSYKWKSHCNGLFKTPIAA